jgi:hypothetical protein
VVATAVVIAVEIAAFGSGRGAHGGDYSTKENFPAPGLWK